jgi:energy-coupling factor transport system permease protein
VREEPVVTPSLYVRRRSFVHALHPVTKVLFLVAVFAAGLVVTHPAPTAVVALHVAGMAILGRTGPAFRAARPLLVLLFLVTALIWTWAYGDGGPRVALGPLALPARGALFGVAMGLRLAAFLAAGLVFLATTRIEAFASALRRLGLPFTAGFVLTLAFRLVPVFVGTAYTVIRAQRARGYEIDRGPIHLRLARRARLLVPIFLSGLRNADGMALALEARGFAPGRPHPGGGRRSDPVDYDFGWRDVLALLSCAGLLGAVAALRAAGLGAV